ncbi:MAG: glycosyl transferase family 3, partial [Mangrovicoccus sp.]|nr:glycosyl transferase family 3 [Mangrovicoccus sp.]
KSRGLPLFLLSAKLVAQAGARVVLHGWNSHQNPIADVRASLDEIEIASSTSPDAARAALEATGITYLPLEALDPRLLELLQLRDVLGLRSPVNTALRALNPCAAPGSVQGVFHPPYRDLQQATSAELGDTTVIVLKGAGGEFERNPAKPIELFQVFDQETARRILNPMLDENRRMADPTAQTGDLARLWHGEITDPFAEATIIGTAALGLFAAGLASDLPGAGEMAQDLWTKRPGRRPQKNTA